MRIVLVVLCLTMVSLAVAAEETLSGVVLGPDGQPAAGATVVTMKLVAQYGMSAVELATDADGRFSYQTAMPTGWELAAIGMPVLARKAGLAMALGKLQPKAPTTLKLGDKPENRTGLVLDPAGKPLAGAAVRLNAIVAPEAPDGRTVGVNLYGLAWADAKTDDAGRFSFADFPSDLIASVRVTAEGFAGAAIRLENADPLTISLKPEATISGKVLVNGQPQANLNVVANSRDGRGSVPCTAKTAPDGTYTIRGLAAGQVSLYVTAPKGMARLNERLLTVKIGDALTALDFAFTPGALVRGTVTDATTGRPVPQAFVTAMQGTHGLDTATTSAEGRYELRLPPGTYRLCTGTRGASTPLAMMTQADGDEITCHEGEAIEDQDLTVRLPRKIAVQLLLPDGAPAAGAELWTSGAYGSPLPAADAQGRLEITAPPLPQSPAQHAWTQPFLLLATHPGQSLAALASFPGTQPLPDTITVKLRPAATATVLITDEQNQPLSSYAVSVGYPFGEGGYMTRGATRSDDHGLIRLTCLPPGEKLRFAPDETLRGLMLDPQWGKETFILTAGETRQLPPIAINPAGRSLQVFVGDAAGQPVKGAQVFAGAARAPQLTDAKGQVTLTKLPLRGKITLIAVHPSQDWFAAEALEPTGDYWPGLLLKPLGQATGLLISKPGGKPLDGYKLYVTPAANDFWRVDQLLRNRLNLMGNRDLATDADGRWHATNLLPGAEYQVVAQAAANTQGPGWGGRLVGQFIAEGGEAQQDVGVFEFEVPAGQ